jgi:hypothetical protein
MIEVAPGAVGWVERSETHYCMTSATGTTDIASLHPSYETRAKWPEIGVSGGFFTLPGLVFSHPIRFHCSSSSIPLIP